MTATTVFTANAQSVGDKFKENGLYYKITQLSPNNQVEVTSQKSNAPYYNNGEKPTGDIAIPQTVTHGGATYTVVGIDNFTFYDCDGITNVNIGDSVTNIGDIAFYNCTALNAITIPNSVTTIGASAFDNCNQATSLTIGNAVTSIGNWAFQNCSSLTAITSKIENVGDVPLGSDVFYAVPKNTCTLYVPKGKVDEYNQAPQWQNFTHITDKFKVGDLYYTITAGNEVEVTSQNGSEPYYNNGEKPTGDITIPKTVTHGGATYTVVGIDNHTFYQCDGITKVTIGNAVTSIGQLAFKNCTSLTAITSIIENVNNVSMGSNVFDGVPKNTCTLYVPKWKKGEYENTDQWQDFTHIDDGIFKKGKLYYTITTDNEVKVTSQNGSNPYYNNGEKTTGDITIPETVTHGGATYTVVGIDNHTFYKCNGITSVNIGDSVTNIGDIAFYNCTALTEITIPNSVTTIGERAFKGCTHATNLTIGNSVTDIEKEAFAYCTSLTAITSKIENISSVSMGSDVFFNVPKNTCTLYVPKGKVNEYSQEPQCQDFTHITDRFKVGGLYYTITAGDEVKVTSQNGNAAPYYNNGEEPTGDIAIPETVTHQGVTYTVVGIDDNAFKSCGGITSVTIGNSITSIGRDAFNNCNQATSLTIGNSVTSIGNYAFWNCSALTAITIPNSVDTIGERAFYTCTHATSLTIGNSVTDIEKEAFGYCEHLTEITSKIENVNNVSLGSGVFDVVPKNTCTLYVPAGKKGEYENADQWEDFMNIVEETPTDVTSTTLSNPIVIAGKNITISHVADQSVKLYTLSGQMLYNLHATQESVTLTVNKAGIYIVQVGNGTRKIIVQ